MRCQGDRRPIKRETCDVLPCFGHPGAPEELHCRRIAPLFALEELIFAAQAVWNPFRHLPHGLVGRRTNHPTCPLRSDRRNGFRDLPLRHHPLRDSDSSPGVLYFSPVCCLGVRDYSGKVAAAYYNHRPSHIFRARGLVHDNLLVADNCFLDEHTHRRMVLGCAP